MSAFFDISAALDARLNTMVGVPSVAWPNTEFTPVDCTLYVRPTVLMGVVERETVGATAKDWYNGIYQIDVFAPVGKGKKEGLEMADTIADQFKRGTELTYNGRTVRILGVAYSSAASGDSFTQTPVTIEFYSLTEER